MPIPILSNVGANVQRYGLVNGVLARIGWRDFAASRKLMGDFSKKLSVTPEYFLLKMYEDFEGMFGKEAPKLSDELKKVESKPGFVKHRLQSSNEIDIKACVESSKKPAIICMEIPEYDGQKTIVKIVHVDKAGEKTKEQIFCEWKEDKRMAYSWELLKTLGDHQVYLVLRYDVGGLNEIEIWLGQTGGSLVQLIKEKDKRWKLWESETNPPWPPLFQEAVWDVRAAWLHKNEIIETSLPLMKLALERLKGF